MTLLNGLRLLLACGLLLGLMPGTSQAVDVLLQNDGFVDGGIAAFQGGFVAGEMAGSRLIAPGPFPMAVKEVLFLFGGSTATRNITLRIYDDPGTGADPGAQIFTGQYQVTGSDIAFQSINLTGDNVMVSGNFRVAIEMTAAGTPSVARDGDGFTAQRNYINAQGLGWVESNLLGLTGDWIIRAVVEGQTAQQYTIGGTVTGLNGTLVLQNNGGDDLVVNADGPFTFATALDDLSAYDVTVASNPPGQTCVVSNGSGALAGADVTNVSITCTDGPGGVTELANDSFQSGQTAAFQAGFLVGEMAASRFVPSAPSQLTAVRFLFGGAAGVTSVRLHVWDDSGLTIPPGTEVFAQDYQVTASDVALQEIDLSGESLFVNDAFRVGLEFLSAGVPSIARDDDGITNGVNFINAGPGVWVLAEGLGVTGDWILRAVVTETPVTTGPLITAIDDIGNDQGRQVRVSFDASPQDVGGSATPIFDYEVYRRIDPLPAKLPASPPAEVRGKLAGWDFVGTVPAHAESAYSVVVPTLADSTITAGQHWSVFLVRAATATPAVFFDSVPDSGYSVDNLAPGAPANLVLVVHQLDWDDAPETDLARYEVFGSDSASFDGNAVSLGQTASPGFDTTGAGYTYYYVRAVDFSGNESDFAQVQDTVTNIDLPSRLEFSAVVHPNPFNPATDVVFRIPRAGEVSIRVFDLRGRHVDSVLDRAFHAAGEHRIAYRSSLPSGVYLLRVESGNDVRTVKIGLVK